MPHFDPLDSLNLSLAYPLLKPPGLGQASDSTGSNPYAARLHNTMYGTADPKAVTEQWLHNLQYAGQASQVILGIPSDTGSGSVRGAALGPIGIREALYADSIDPRSVADIGDVLCVPHLLHDDLLNKETIIRVQNALYGDSLLEFPVSPLSIAEFLVRGILARDSPPAIIGLGGDHSVSGALVPQFLAQETRVTGIVHIDAHSDLSTARFGLPLTYSSWLNFVDNRIKIPGIAQVGLHALQGIQESGTRLMHVGRDACISARTVAEHVASWLRGKGIDSVYISVDIDATDRSHAPGTGLPAEDGLSPEFVVDFIAELSDRMTVAGGDVVEVAPPLGDNPRWSDESTCRTAAAYVAALLTATRTERIRSHTAETK